MDKIQYYHKKIPAIFDFAFAYMQPEQNPDLVIDTIKKDNYPFTMVSKHGIDSFIKDLGELLTLDESEWFSLSGYYLGIVGKSAEERYRKIFEVVLELALAERRRLKKEASEQISQEEPKTDYLIPGQTLIKDLMDDKS